METMTFGPTYVPALDRERIAGQMRQVLDLMQDGQWRTLFDIAGSIDAPESSVSAQLRHLRKPKFGGFVVEKRRLTSGTWVYRVSDPLPIEQDGQLLLLQEVS